MGTIANVFYSDMGYTKTQIATITKTFGLVMTIAGGFFGGVSITIWCNASPVFRRMAGGTD